MASENRILVVGTSHIAKQSVEEVRKSFEQFNPDIIALELDILRFQSLIAKKQNRNFTKELKHFGVKGVILNTIGSWIENKLGQKVNMKPGAEMKEGIKLSREHKKEVALIDQDIRITMKKLTSGVKFKEKLRIFLDLFRIPFAKKQMGKIDLTKVPDQEFIDTILEKVKSRYPGIYKILIEDRNKIIAKNLNKLRKDKKEKKILAIIGAGHKKEVEKLISDDIF